MEKVKGEKRKAEGESEKRKAESGNTRTDRGCVEDQPQRLERTRPLEYLVRCLLNSYTLAAMDFGLRRGVSDEHIRSDL